MIREPAVAGLFYEADKDELRESVEAAFLGPYGPGRLPVSAPFVSRNIVGLVSPHAGLIYSGNAAAHAYVDLADDGLPDTAVIIGVNHRGIGASAAVMVEGSWRTPMGDVEIDSGLAEAAISYSEVLVEDALAHSYEHSLELQLPFLQYLSPKIKIVPIVLGLSPWESDSLSYAIDIGHAVSRAMKDRNVVVVASTDFTHQEPKAVAEDLDGEAIRCIEALDHAGLLSVVSKKNITMCGALPTAAVMVASSDLGATKGEMLTYYTSGDITGDNRSVVGYGALKLVKE